MNININGKGLLAAAILSSGLVFANYVSFVDVKSAGGITVEEITEEELDDFFLSKHPVGTITMRMDAVNPSTIYGGTWRLITGDASLTFGDGSKQSNVAVGENTPVVPIPHHSHSASFKGNALAAHTHSHTKVIGYQSSSVSSAGLAARTVPDSGWGSYVETGRSTPRSVGVRLQGGSDTTGSASSGTPSGSVTITAAGEANQTLDVRGARISVNVWERTS